MGRDGIRHHPLLLVDLSLLNMSLHYRQVLLSNLLGETKQHVRQLIHRSKTAAKDLSCHYFIEDHRRLVAGWARALENFNRCHHDIDILRQDIRALEW